MKFHLEVVLKEIILILYLISIARYCLFPSKQSCDGKFEVVLPGIDLPMRQVIPRSLRDRDPGSPKANLGTLGANPQLVWDLCSSIFNKKEF